MNVSPQEGQGLLAHERDWLAYCRRVVRDGGHRTACALRGGSPAGSPEVFTDVRWPGYLGADYQPGGLMWVNIIHEDLGQRGFRAGASRLADATANWRDADPDDEKEDAKYLSEQRAGYMGGLSTWNVRHLIRNVAHDTLDVPLAAMAYGNAGRCQAPLGTNAHKQQNRIVRFCQEWLPLSEAMAALRPSVLIVTSAELLRRMPTPLSDVLVVGISQRHRVLKGSPWQPGDRPWCTALAQDWHGHRNRIGL